MRVNLKGVHTVRRGLADGSVRVHYYAWRGGPRIDAEPGTDAFIAAYQREHARRKAPSPVDPSALSAVIARFRGSGDFTSKADTTRREYAVYLDLIDDQFGDWPLALFNEPKMRGEIKAWRDTMRDTPRKADFAIAVLKRLLSWAVDNGELGINAAAKMGRLHKADHSAQVWTDADFTKLAKHAHVRTVWAVRFAAFTGLRRSDLVRIPYAADRGAYLDWTTGKTKARIIVPILPEARALMDAMPETSGPIIRGVRGEPLTPAGFSANVGKAKRAAKVAKRIHDLRGTAATRYALAGLDDREIASILGWKEAQVAEIRRVYVSGTALALRAVEKLSGNGPGKRSKGKGAK